MIRTLTAAAMLLPTAAHAWRHSGEVLAPEDRPLRWSVEVDPQVANLTPEQVIADLKTAFQAWDDAACGLEIEFVGEVVYDDPTDVPDGELHFTFAPLGANSSAWVRLGTTPPVETVFEREGREYTRLVPGAWVINTDLSFASDQAIEGGDCFGQLSFSTVMSLLVGDRLGLGFSSDRTALMSFDIDECQIRRPAADDAEGLAELYGTWVGFACENADEPSPDGGEVFGVVPFEARCEIQTDGRSTIDGTTWHWGDGGTSEGLDVTHTYTAEDNYGIRLEVSGTHPTCGDFDRRVQRFNYVRACGAPQPSFRAERRRGLEYRLVNDSDVSTYGCHSNVRWTVFDEADVVVAEERVWEPIVVFPENGRYRVELALEGPGGETVFEDWVDTREGSVRGYTVGPGCSQAPAGGSLAWLLVGGLALVTRRRRE